MLTHACLCAHTHTLRSSVHEHQADVGHLDGKSQLFSLFPDRIRFSDLDLWAEAGAGSFLGQEGLGKCTWQRDPSPSRRYPRPLPCISAHRRADAQLFRGLLNTGVSRYRCEAHVPLLPLAAVCRTKMDVLIFGIWPNSLSSLTCGVAAIHIIMEKPSESS